MTVLWVFVVLLASLPTRDCQHQKSVEGTNRASYFVLGRPHHGLVPTPQYNPTNATKQDYYSQTLDHFSPTDVRTFKQKYFYNNAFYEKGGPIFLLLGGEFPEKGAFLNNGETPLMKWAEKLKASVFSLEHRYYGDSHPFDETDVHSLKYLSSKQALEDIAEFIKDRNERLQYKNPKWVVFGGSYAGSLAAWFRAKHPELVVGAVASSAPLEIKLDFYEYTKVVERSLKSVNPSCADAVSEGFHEVTSLTRTEDGRKQLQKVFNFYPKMSESLQAITHYNNFPILYHRLASAFAYAVQYSGDNVAPYADEGDIASVCKLMLMDKASKSALERLMDVVKHMRKLYNQNITEISIDYQAMVDSLKQKSYADQEKAASRLWLWQRCTELGLFATTDTDENIFMNGAPLNFEVDLCDDVFGRDITQVADSVRETQKYYGRSEDYKGKNVVLPYGELDPWHVLGKLTSKDESVVPCRVKGFAHCADMYPERVKGEDDLKNVRKIIYNNIRKWLDLSVDGPLLCNTDKARKEEKQDVCGRCANMAELTSPITILPLPDIEKIRAENSPPRLLYDVPSVIHGRPINGLLLPPGIPSYVKRFPPGFEAGFIVQPLDHFNTTREQILLQNFWHNPEYYKKGGPVFLMISGDNDGKISWLLNPEVHIARCAKKFGASIFLLEHRYYGKSKPHTINGTNDLRWLTSRQALEDIALFIRSTSRDRKYKNARWIIFGGSYAGALSAWFRQLHPELAIGAIASSAPLQAKVDFYEHLMVTQRAIKRHDEQCLRNIGEAFKLVYLKTFTKDGKMNLTNEYKLTQSFNETSLPVDFAYFFSIIYGYFQAAVQYSGVNVEYYAAENMIKNICDMMTKKGSLFNNIVEYHKSMVEFYEKEFNHTENSYQSLLEYYKEPSPARFWLYQTCTEFGYYLSTDLGRNVFGTTYPISFDLKLCRDVFGSDFTADTIHRAVKKTNDYYGGADNYKGTNVVMINGDIDPWSALGHYKERETVVNYLVEGSAHCADMYPSREEDVPGLAVARKIIEDNIEKWIEQSAPPPTEKPTETTTETTKGHSPSTKQTKTTRKIQTTKGHSPSTKQTKTTRKIQTTTTSGSESLTLKILFTLMFPFLAFSLRCCR